MAGVVHLTLQMPVGAAYDVIATLRRAAAADGRGGLMHLNRLAVRLGVSLKLTPKNIQDH